MVPYKKWRIPKISLKENKWRQHKIEFYGQGTNKSQQMKQNVKVLTITVFNEKF